jgi:ubiquinone/menaquinone biosynthesis C-methylase UbiE
MNSKRLNNEIAHGKFITEKGEEIWNWSSAAGKVRWERRANLFIDFIGSDNKILEICCGTGLFTKEIQHKRNLITAMDISPDLIQLAKKRISNPNVEFVVGNAYETGFKDDSFDIIIGSSALHHLEVEPAIKEFYRILKPRGRIFFTEPNMLNPQIAIQKNIPFIKRIAGDSPDETAFTKFGISRRLKKAGFKKIDVRPFDFLHPAIPSVLLKIMIPFGLFLEKIPIIKHIAGSLIITGVK